MNRLVQLLSIVAVLSLSINCFGQEPENRKSKKDAKPRRAAAADQAYELSGEDGNAKRQRQAGQIDPARMVERMMQEFDKDGDQKLDATELTALLSKLRDLRGRFAGQSSELTPEGKPQNRNRPGNKGKRGNDSAEPQAGGDTPIRPRGDN